MPLSNHITAKNRLLAAMPQEDLQHFFSELYPVCLSLRQVLCEAGAPLEHVYFIEQGVASILTSMADGSTIEVGMIGMEGMVGVPALLGGEISAQQIIVQVPGTALRMSAALCKAAFDQSEAVRRVALRFTEAILNLSAQTAACNRPHSNGQDTPHARVSRLDAWRTARRGHRYRRRAPALRLDPLSSRPAHDRRSQRPRSERLRVLPDRSRAA